MSDAAKEYGGALFSLALDEGIDSRILSELRVIRSLFSENPGYIRLLSSPNIPKEERLSCLHELLSERVHPYILNFLKIITERNHVRSVFGCLDEFEDLYYETHGIIRAKAESAVPMTDDQRERLAARVASMTGKQVELDCTVNPALLGGVRLTVNNRLYEGSVKAKLREIGDRLDSVTL
jgi:F-type H+-transporting ATPase subunit delta